MPSIVTALALLIAGRGVEPPSVISGKLVNPLLEGLLSTVVSALIRSVALATEIVVGAAAIVMARDEVIVPPALVALIVTLKVPAWVGIPEMSPVPVSRKLKPGGKGRLTGRGIVNWDLVGRVPRRRWRSSCW